MAKAVDALSTRERWTAPARFFEYTCAADPDVPAIPFVVFPSTLHTPAPAEEARAHTHTHTHAHTHASGLVPLDLSLRLRSKTPCTSPNLLASFLVVAEGESVTTTAAASSHVFYVMRGAGTSTLAHAHSRAHAAPEGAARTGTGADMDADTVALPPTSVAWSTGDLFTIPGVSSITHAASAAAALYYVCDAPLLAYLGAVPERWTFQPTMYTQEALARQLAEVTADPAWRSRNRNGVLLGTAATCDEAIAAPATLTLTPSMWALYNALPARVTQRPHRHNSVALDLCVAAGPNTYTLMAAAVDADGELVPPVTRADWLPGAVFVTPPGMWHSHHNESDVDAIVLPVQDAGLHTFMRTLDIRFSE